MRTVLRSLLAVSFAVGFASAALADKRVALIVANGDYKGAALQNPTVDADLVAASLRNIGFDAKVVKDADLGKFDDAVTAFADDAKGADVALFYFAGHGFTVNDGVRPVSVLMSTSADVAADSERVLRAGGIPLDDIVASLAGAGQGDAGVRRRLPQRSARQPRRRRAGARLRAPRSRQEREPVHRLVDEARRHGAGRRGGQGQPVRAGLRRQHPGQGRAHRRRVPADCATRSIRRPRASSFPTSSRTICPTARSFWSARRRSSRSVAATPKCPTEARRTRSSPRRRRFGRA